MLNFPLKSLFALMAVAGVTTFSLTRPSMIIAMLVAVAAVLIVICAMVQSIKRRHSVAILLACLCGCYLVVADGGVFPQAAKRLPAEWLMNQFAKQHTVIDDGRKRTSSLAKWYWRVCFEKQHKDLELVTAVSGKSVFSIDSELNHNAIAVCNTTVKLPKFVLAPITTIKTTAKRDNPQNRAFYMIGHGWCVISISSFAIMGVSQTRSKDSKKRVVSGCAGMKPD